MNMPKLIILCGIPGSGKTTYAIEYIKEHGGYRLSSDDIRKQLYGDESIQGNPSEVFSIMQNKAIAALNQGTTVVYDATGITRKDRASIISACPKFVKIECHVIWAPIETCIERDAARERTVGKEVVDKMLKRFQPPFYDEGFNDIKIILPDWFIGNEYENKCMEDMKIPHDNPHHTANIFDHCMHSTLHAINNKFTMDVKVAALYHDIGKPYVKAFIDSKGNECDTAHYYQHQCVGAWMAYGLEVSPFVVWLIGVHMDTFFNTKYYNKLPPFLKKQVDLLHEADLAGH
jgi:putative nucleotidyltransferase with HDIG domain